MTIFSQFKNSATVRRCERFGLISGTEPFYWICYRARLGLLCLRSLNTIRFLFWGSPYYHFLNIAVLLQGVEFALSRQSGVRQSLKSQGYCIPRLQ